MISASFVAGLAPFFAGPLCYLLFVLCKISLVQAVWVRRREIEEHAAKNWLLPQSSSETFAATVYYKVVSAEAPNASEASAFALVIRQSVENYVLIERAKRELAWFSSFKTIRGFLEFCDERQGNKLNFLNKVIISDDLSKYVFQGRLMEDDAVLKKFHKIKTLGRNSARFNSNNLEQANA